MEAQTTYDAASDYALTQGGTTGNWFYGYSASDLDDTFIQYVQNDSVPSCNGGMYQRWFDPMSGDLTPQIARNTASTICVNIPPEALFFHPGPTGRRSILRWTAPVAGTFQVTGALGKQNNGATTDIRILKNAVGTPLFIGNIGDSFQQPFDFPVTVTAGETLDFSVGWGNGSYNGDGSTLAVRIAIPATACLPPPANLQVWLPGENSSVDVQSGNTRGVLAGDASYGPGKVGRAFTMDESGDYVVVPDNAAQQAPVDAVTMEGWFRFRSFSGLVSLISKPLRNSALNSYGLYLENGQLRGLIGNSSQYTRALTPYVPPLNEWTHLAATFSRSGGASTMKLYANGIEVTSGVDGTPNIPISYDADPFPLLIGGEYEGNGPAFYLNGDADEPSVYSRALTQQEISSLVVRGSFGKCLPSPLPLQPVPAMPPANQIASWTADGDAGDFNGLNPTGILRGDAHYCVGRVGQAFNLDGNGDYIEVADNANHRPMNQLTAEGWFKFNNFNNLPHLIAKGLRGTDRNSYVMWHANGNIRLGYSDSGSNFIFYATGFAPKAGEFDHYAMVINTDDTGENADTFKLYVNGKQVFSGAAGAPIFYDASPHPLTIGVDVNNDIFDYPLSGQVDEVSLYSRALTASEIAGIYNAGTAGILKSKATAAGSNVATQLSDTTITFTSVSTSGVTSQSGIDPGLLPPLPSNVVYTGLAYDLSTSAVYQNARRNDVVVAFNAAALPSAKFNQLRILQLENDVWVNRTDRTSIAPVLGTNNVKSLSPYVIVEAEAAFAGLVDQYTAEDAAKSFDFQVTIPESITEITATSGNPAVVPNNPDNLTVTGSGTTRTVFVNPAPDQHGEVELTITVTRGITSLTDRITLTVTGVNDAPVAVADILSSVAEDSAQRTITAAALLANDSRGSANEGGQGLTLTEVSNAVGGTVGLSGTDVHFTPAPDFNGTASFAYTIQDNGTTDGAASPLTTSGTVSFAVTEVNDAPTAAADSLASVLEDSGARTIPFATLTANDSTGPANESSQALVVSAVSNPVGGTVIITGTDVVFNPAPNYNGAAGFSYTAQDIGTTNAVNNPVAGTPAGVSFTILPVNDAPSFVKGADQTNLEDAGAVPASGWATSILRGPVDEAGQTVSFSVTNDNNPLFATQPAIAPNGTLTYTPATHANGLAMVTVSLNDNGGTADGGQASSAAQTFTISITPVNDAPTFNIGPDQLKPWNAGAQSIVGWATSLSPGPSNENAQNLQFMITANSDPGLFSVAPSVTPPALLAIHRPQIAVAPRRSPSC